MKLQIAIALVFASGVAHAGAPPTVRAKTLTCGALTWDGPEKAPEETDFRAYLKATDDLKSFEYNIEDKESWTTKNGRYAISVFAMQPLNDSTINDTIIIHVTDLKNDAVSASAGSLNVGDYWKNVKVDDQEAGVSSAKDSASMNVTCHLK